MENSLETEDLRQNENWNGRNYITMRRGTETLAMSLTVQCLVPRKPFHHPLTVRAEQISTAIASMVPDP